MDAGRQAADGFFMGRVLLEDFAAGDQVVISDLNGLPTAEAEVRALKPSLP
jgi:hypothetical protein